MTRRHRNTEFGSVQGETPEVQETPVISDAAKQPDGKAPQQEAFRCSYLCQSVSETVLVKEVL